MNKDQPHNQSDLAWIINTPSIHISVDHAPFDTSKLHLKNRRNIEYQRKLGRYFEELMAFLLSENNYEILLKNHQIIEDKKTLGEVDFIVQNKKGTKIHLEIAIKFYMEYGDHWLGPNSTDSLEKKINKLQNHQLALPLPISVDQKMYYMPVIKFNKNLASDFFWLYPHELDKKTMELPWEFISKPNWLSGFHSLLISDWEQEIGTIESSNKVRQYVIKKDNMITKRLMVVPSSWPNR